MASLAAALVCVLAAVVGYGLVSMVERMRDKPATRTSPHMAAAKGTPALPSRAPGEMPLWADALNSDLGHIYEPGAATSLLSREAEYGWPRPDDTVITGGTLQ